MQTINYELHELEPMMLARWDLPPTSKGDDAQFMNTISAEAARVRKALTQEVFSFNDERHLERYIQYHQQALIRLLDSASSQMSKPSANTQTNDLNKFFYNTLEDLLDFVERHFAKYFDQDAKAPEAYIAIARHDAQQHLLTLTDQFALLKADPALADIALYALRKLISLPTTREITYRKIMYVKELQKELFHIIDSAQPDQPIDSSLLQSMYYLNYNSMRCFSWHAKYLASQLAGAHTHEERVEVLSLLLKNVNQSQVKPGIAYHPKSLPLKAQLAAYVAEEMEYEERIFQLGNFPKPTTDAATLPYTLKLELSVAQISFLVRILIETNIIVNKNVNETLRFFARYTTSKRSGSITFGSLRVKYYENEVGTKESVKNLLSSMVKFIDKG